MDIGELISALKEGRAIVREPIRLRRKPRKRKTRARLYEGSAKQKECLREADRRYWKSLKGRWRGMKKKYGETWQISLEEWKALWTQCPPAQIGEQLVPIFRLRGPRKEDAKIYRLSYSKAWTLENVGIWYNRTAWFQGRNVQQEEIPKEEA